MRYLPYLVMAAVGFTVSVVFGLANNASANTDQTLGLGFVGALIFIMIQFLCSSFVGRHCNRKLVSRRPTKPRVESEGSFEDRMERFTANVERSQADLDYKSTAPLWTASDSDEYELTPPKSIGVIRMLLRRIKRILAGG